MESIDAEVKERLERWRVWAFSAHFPGMLPGQSTIESILKNTAQAANQTLRPEPCHAECEETDMLVTQLLSHPDTYLGGLAVQMKYTAHAHTPTEYLAKLFPTTYSWNQWKNEGGNFDEYREKVRQSQYLKRTNPDHFAKSKVVLKLGVTDRSFAEAELEGRKFLVGKINFMRCGNHHLRGNVYNLAVGR